MSDKQRTAVGCVVVRQHVAAPGEGVIAPWLGDPDAAPEPLATQRLEAALRARTASGDQRGPRLEELVEYVDSGGTVQIVPAHTIKLGPRRGP